MKKILLLILLVSLQSASQNKYLTKTGSITFEASVPSFEEVAAKNKSVTAIINTTNGEFAALALVQGFRFKNALMEEHFNETYAESSTYPKATFKGVIEGFSSSSIEQASVINGELMFHGVKKTLQTIAVKIIKQENIYTMSGSFKLSASDFNIKIPKIVAKKVSEEVLVTFNFILSQN